MAVFLCIEKRERIQSHRPICIVTNSFFSLLSRQTVGALAKTILFGVMIVIIAQMSLGTQQNIN